MCVRSRADHAPPEVEPDAEGCAAGRGRRRRRQGCGGSPAPRHLREPAVQLALGMERGGICGERGGVGGICASRCRGRSRRGETAIAGATGSGPIAELSGQRGRRWNNRDRVAERCPHLCCWLGERAGAVAGSARHAGCAVISLAAGTKVFLACRPVDLRNGFDGLAAKAQQVIGADPFSGHLFIFRGERGDSLKGLYWDGSGMWLLAKRLEKGRFVWPPMVDGAMTLSPAQFSVLIEAMDWRRTLAPPPLPQPVLV